MADRIFYCTAPVEFAKAVEGHLIQMECSESNYSVNHPFELLFKGVGSQVRKTLALNKNQPIKFKQFTCTRIFEPVNLNMVRQDFNYRIVNKAPGK